MFVYKITKITLNKRQINYHNLKQNGELRFNIYFWILLKLFSTIAPVIEN